MKSIKQNFIYNSIYQILVMAIPFITKPYISRILGAEGIGIYAFANSIAYYFVLFAHLGLNNYGNRTIARVRDDRSLLSKTFWSIYGMQILTSIVSISIYLLYVLLISSDKTVSFIMLVYVVSAGIDINWFFFGQEDFKFTAIRSMVIKVLTVVCIFLFVKTPSDVYVYCIIYVVGMFLSQLLLWTRIRKNVDFYKPSASDIFVHLKPNLVLFIPVIAVSLYKIMDKIMIGFIKNKTEVGYYESCESVIQIPIALVNSLGTVMLPRMSNLVSKNDKEASTKYIEKSIIFALFLSSSMCFGIMGISKEFVPLFYGAGYEKCIILFQVLMPSCLFLAFANVIRTQHLIPHQKDREYICSVFVGAFVNLVINIILIPKWGSIGAAVGTVFAELSVCLSQCIMVRKDLNIKRYVLSVLPFIISGFLMYILLIMLPLTNVPYIFATIIKIVIGILLYFVFLVGIEFIYKYAFRNYYFDMKKLFLTVIKKRK